MADDKNKTLPGDAQRVNLDEEYEVAYWSDRFRVTPDRLRKAVAKVGPMAKEVERELRGTHSGSA